MFILENLQSTENLKSTDKNESYPLILLFRDNRYNILVYFSPFVFL